jgi:hypothetical protein
VTALLDMQEVVQRQATWQFEIVDQNLQGQGTLELDRDKPPTMTVDVSRAVKRSLTNVTLVPGEVDNVDVIQDRLRVTMITDDGMVWPQGVFMFTDVSRLRLTAGLPLDIGALALVDQGLIVDQQLTYAVTAGPGTLITEVIAGLLSELPIAYNLTPSGAVINPTAEALAWPAGTSRLRVVNELALMVGYHQLYFDNDGIAQLHPMPNPPATPDDQVLRYPPGTRTFRGSQLTSTNILQLPNRFVVVSSGVTNIPIYGVYEVPADAPHSTANRGFEIAQVEQAQGIATVADAEVAAAALARDWRFPFETLEFQGPPDPRHDHYNTVEFESILYLEKRWVMSCVEGSGMSHTLHRVYEAA